jgi:predicted glycosyltransferase|tara:strand:- start:231 stop:1316 length:1086 start_codon:yes stop_codon:yes gene_type:complete
MIIWIDILTPKQILFFTPLIQDLEAKGHEVLTTSRKYLEVELLASLKGLDLTFVGRHGGASLMEKLKASCERTLHLSDYVRKLGINYAVSFSSPECARVAFGMNVKHFCISDSPNSEKVCQLTIPLSDTLLTPQVIPSSVWRKYGISEDRIVTYNALDTAVWLKRRPKESARKEDYGLDASKKTITIRLEESQAYYIPPSAESYTNKLLDSLLLNFPDCEIFVLGRYAIQIEAVKKAYGPKVKIVKNAVDGAGLLSVSDVFIGRGSTMAQEAALLGVPSVSASPGWGKDGFWTEKFLISEGLLDRPESIEGIISKVGEFLQDETHKKNLQRHAKRVLEHMEDPIGVMIKTLEKSALEDRIL